MADTEQSIISPMNQDEEVIKKAIETEKFESETEALINDEELTEFLVNHITQRYDGRPIVIAFTGAPASGKTTQIERILVRLRQGEHTADVIRTDNFNRSHRKERNERIAQGSDPLEVKDFELLKEIVADVRDGRETQAPVYDESTGDAVVIGGEQAPYDKSKFPHKIEAGLHFLFVEGDFQPLDDPDLRIYLHVPTDVRRENRVARDLEKRGGYGDADAIRQSFDSRLQTQYYPYTLPNAEKSDILITAQAEKVESHEFANRYSYSVLMKSNLTQPNPTLS